MLILCLLANFSVLIDFHNNLVELLKNEIETNGNNLGLGPLQDIIIDLSKREISILQIAESNLGVISIDETDCRWVEQLARAIVDNEDNYFLTYGSPLNFQFVYFQTYLIRTYLLYCHINYTHFEGKYHYHVQPRMPAVIERHGNIEDPTFDGSDLNEWNHLKLKSLDQLKNEFEFIQRLKTLLGTYQQDCSTMMLSEFVQLFSDDYRFAQQYEKYEIKEFRLSQMEDICGFYQQAIIRVQNAYNHVSSTIDVPMSDVVIAGIDQVLIKSFLPKDNQGNKEELEGKMRVITDLLEELKNAQEDLARRSSQPFAETCKHWGFESLILELIPADVKCENYVPLCVKLIEIRSRLQERSIAIQEKNEEKWAPYLIPSQVHETKHTIQTEIPFEEFDKDANMHLHLEPSRSISKNFDNDEKKLTDLARSQSQFNDLEANENNQKDFAHSQASFEDFSEDEDTLQQLSEFHSNFEETDESNLNRLVSYQPKVDDFSRVEDQTENLTQSHPDFEGVDLEEDKVTDVIQSQQNLEKSDGHKDQHRDLVQIIPQVGNMGESEGITQHPASTQSQTEDSDEHKETNTKESTHHSQLHPPYRFKSKLRAISFTPAAVFIKTHDLAEKLKSSEVPKRFEITFVDGTTENKLSGGPERLYGKLKTAFDERRYSFDSMAIVDSLGLFVDFTKTVADGSLPRVDIKYRVLKKTALITVKIEFEKDQYLYQATELANISSILARLIIDNNLQFSQLENYFNVFDAFGWYVAEDCPLNKFYGLDDRSSIDIRIVRCSQQMKICEMSRVDALDNADEVKPLIDCFHLTTKWQQIGSRLNLSTLNTDQPVGNIYFWDMTKNIIINGDEQISSSIGDAESIVVLALKKEDVMSIVLSYDQTSMNILMPKHCSVDHLLRNEIYLNQLNLETSSQDYSLVLVSTDSIARVLVNNEMSRPIGSFESNEGDKIHFQISIFIRIFFYGEQRKKSTAIPHRNFTVQQLLETIETDEDFKYLASYETKAILPLDLSLSTIPDTKFFLARKNQIGYLWIKRTSNDEGLSQRYLFDATIDHIYKQNKINEESRYLMLDNDFVPSRQTSLNLFLSASKTDSIVFTMTDKTLSVNLTVINKEGDRSISFRCSHSILAPRLVEIVCNLWKLKQRFYRLKTSDEIFLDPQDSIADYNESADDLQMTLETKANVKCTIAYQGRSVTIPSDDDVQASAIIEEALEIFCIPLKQKAHYGLMSVNNPNDPIRFESGDSIKNLRDCFKESSEHLLFELRVLQSTNDDQ